MKFTTPILIVLMCPIVYMVLSDIQIQGQSRQTNGYVNRVQSFMGIALEGYLRTQRFPKHPDDRDYIAKMCYKLAIRMNDELIRPTETPSKKCTKCNQVIK